MEKISIIIPAYNTEKYIEKCISSALNQTYENIEVVVIDDGSTDRTLDAARECAEKDHRIVLETQANKGVSAARNHGLDIASGDYVMFLDSDDWLEPDAAETLMNETSGNNKVLVGADFFDVCLNEGNELCRESMCCGDQRMAFERNDCLMYFDKSEYRLRSSCYKLFSMAVIRANDLRFNEKIHHGEDGLFVFDYVCLMDKFIYLPKALWNIYDRPGSATKSSYNKKMLSSLDAVNLMLTHDDLNEEIVKMLKSYYVERALSVEWTAIDEENSEDDVKFLRGIVRKNFSDYFYTKRTLSNFLYILLMGYSPLPIVRFVKKHKK